MFKTFLGVSIFNISAAVLGLFLNITYAKTLTIVDYGNLYFLLSLLYIINYVIDGGISQSIVVFSSKGHSKNRHEYIQFVFKRYYKYLIVSFVLSILASSIILYYYNLLTFQNFILLFVCGIMTSLAKILISFFQGEKQWLKFNISNISLNFFKIVPLLIIIFLSDKIGISDITWILIFSSLSQFILVLSFIFWKDKSSKNLVSKYDSYNLKKSFSNHFYSLIGITFITVIASRVDILITKQFLSNEELGLYSMGSSLALIFPIITNSLMQVLLSFSKELDKVDILKSNFLIKLIGISVIIILLFTVAPTFLDWLFSSRYNDSIKFFQFLSIIHVIGLIFTPLETVYLVKKPKLICFLKFFQLLILIITPIFMNVSLWTILLGVLFSRLAAWLFLTYNYYHDKKLFIPS
jgi:O-antigen/teichoic acid export membrane protein